MEGLSMTVSYYLGELRLMGYTDEVLFDRMCDFIGHTLVKVSAVQEQHARSTRINFEFEPSAGCDFALDKDRMEERFQLAAGSVTDVSLR